MTRRIIGLCGLVGHTVSPHPHPTPPHRQANQQAREADAGVEGGNKHHEAERRNGVRHVYCKSSDRGK